MKRIIPQALIAIAAIFIFSTAAAQTNQSFNTSAEAPDLNQVKSYLQGKCWTFQNMDINAAGPWDPGIEGDGAITTLPLRSGQTAGLYTPMLDIPGSLAVSFFYRFSYDIEGASYVKFYLAGHDNTIYMELDSLSLVGLVANTTYLYSNTFASLPSGPYRLFIQYVTPTYSSLMAIDNMELNVPLVYPEGCNGAPVAVNDHITGNSNRTATGQVITNDYDPNGDVFTPYIITNSPHGTVEMNESGSFTFTPNPGFTGNSTTFTYQECDNGFSPQCSNIATVTITFAGGMLPVKLSDFRVSVNDASDVTLNWTTTYEQGSDHFEIERSFDGANFEKVGSVAAAGTSFTKKDYSYLDRLRSSVTNKKDVYYRLRLVNSNGTAEVTKVLVLRLFRTSTLKMVSVTPNPVVNDINVQVQLKESSYVVMKVTNSNGLEVSRKSSRGNQGLNVFALDGTNTLKPGVYMLEVIINSSERMSIKLVKN
ncbi:MAG TPA: Ig-like domain-containing protein [Chitinophagaceae bacterium]|nr:Ig-like domain-containing protein [Chitinophagaceae bacterium]